MLVRNGSRVGVDWRAAAALVGIVVALSTVAITLLGELWAFQNHLVSDRPSAREWERHLYSADSEKHLTNQEYAIFRARVEVLWQFDARLRSLETGQNLMLEQMGIPLPVRPKSVGLPPGMQEPGK